MPWTSLDLVLPNGGRGIIKLNSLSFVDLFHKV